MAISLRYTKDREEALEVINEGFLKVFRDVQKFIIPDKQILIAFKAWIKKIIIYTAIDYYRANVKYKNHEEINEKVIEIHSDDENVLSDLSYEDLIKVIQQLTPAYRTVFNLFVIDGFSHEEIAVKLGISAGTSKSNLAKARINLREILKKSNKELYAKYTR